MSHHGTNIGAKERTQSRPTTGSLGPYPGRHPWAGPLPDPAFEATGSLEHRAFVCHRRVTPAGSVLALVLIVLSSMVILSVGLSYRTRIELRLAQAYARRTQAYYLALGSVARATVLVTGSAASPQRVGLLGRFAGTAQGEGLFEQLPECGVDQQVLMYRVRDEQAYLNVNRSDPVAWSNIPGMDATLMASILDWTDADDSVRPQGAEADYFSHLSPPYVAKNLPCTLLRELLLVRGVTAERYMGMELSRYRKTTEWNATGSDRRNSISPGIDLDLGLLDLFTVFGDGKININTVGSRILAALPGFDERAAQAVLTHRAGPDGIEGTRDDIPLTSAQELRQIDNLTALQIELLSQYCCFQSTTFRVFSFAELSDGSLCSLMATLDASTERLAILCMEILR